MFTLASMFSVLSTGYIASWGDYFAPSIPLLGQFTLWLTLFTSVFHPFLFHIVFLFIVVKYPQ